MNKYIKVFNTDTDYQSFISGEIDKPNLSYVKATNEVHYNPFIDYSKEYLTFEALQNGTFTLTVPAAVNSTYMTSISYSVDNGSNWITTAIDNTDQTITTPTINAGDKVLWKGEGKTLSFWDNNTEISKFSSTGNYNVSGNIMSLLYGDNFQNQTTLPTYTGNNGRHFTKLWQSSKIVSARNLILPATTLSQRCYSSMFVNSRSLTTAPELPATTLATTASGCYSDMFEFCTALTTAPELPATTLTGSCYYYMFSGCTSLTTAPTLPATTLATDCYSYMFNGCTSLTTAPVLPATTLVNSCYSSMFSSCYKLTTAPELPATTLTEKCYHQMFNNCTNLNNIKMLATDISATKCLDYWVNGVAATGTFTKAASMTSLPSGASGIPANWTVVDATA